MNQLYAYISADAEEGQKLTASTLNKWKGQVSPVDPQCRFRGGVTAEILADHAILPVEMLKAGEGFVADIDGIFLTDGKPVQQGTIYTQAEWDALQKAKQQAAEAKRQAAKIEPLKISENAYKAWKAENGIADPCSPEDLHAFMLGKLAEHNSTNSLAARTEILGVLVEGIFHILNIHEMAKINEGGKGPIVDATVHDDV